MDGIPLCEVAATLGLTPDELRSLNPHVENVADDAILPMGLKLYRGTNSRRRLLHHTVAPAAAVAVADHDPAADETPAHQIQHRSGDGDEDNNNHHRNAANEHELPSPSPLSAPISPPPQPGLTASDIRSKHQRMLQSIGNVIPPAAAVPRNNSNTNNISSNRSRSDSLTAVSNNNNNNSSRGFSQIPELTITGPTPLHSRQGSVVGGYGEDGSGSTTVAAAGLEMDRSQISSRNPSSISSATTVVRNDNDQNDDKKTPEADARCETLADVSRKTSVPVDVLRSLNPQLQQLADNDAVPAGTPLRLGRKRQAQNQQQQQQQQQEEVDDDAQQQQQQLQRRPTLSPEQHQRMMLDELKSKQVQQQQTRQQQKQTSLRQIADELNIPVNLLRQANPALDDFADDAPLPEGAPVKVPRHVAAHVLRQADGVGRTSHPSSPTSPAAPSASGGNNVPSLTMLSQHTNIPVEELRRMNPVLPSQLGDDDPIPTGTQLNLSRDASIAGLPPVAPAHSSPTKHGTANRQPPAAPAVPPRPLSAAATAATTTNQQQQNEAANSSPSSPTGKKAPPPPPPPPRRQPAADLSAPLITQKSAGAFGHLESPAKQQHQQGSGGGSGVASAVSSRNTSVLVEAGNSFSSLTPVAFEPDNNHNNSNSNSVNDAPSPYNAATNTQPGSKSDSPMLHLMSGSASGLSLQQHLLQHSEQQQQQQNNRQDDPGRAAAAVQQQHQSISREAAAAAAARRFHHTVVAAPQPLSAPLSQQNSSGHFSATSSLSAIDALNPDNNNHSHVSSVRVPIAGLTPNAALTPLEFDDADNSFAPSSSAAAAAAMRVNMNNINDTSSSSQQQLARNPYAASITPVPSRRASLQIGGAGGGGLLRPTFDPSTNQNNTSALSSAVNTPAAGMSRESSAEYGSLALDSTYRSNQGGAGGSRNPATRPNSTTFLSANPSHANSSGSGSGINSGIASSAASEAASSRNPSVTVAGGAQSYSSLTPVAAEIDGFAPTTTQHDLAERQEMMNRHHEEQQQVRQHNQPPLARRHSTSSAVSSIGLLSVSQQPSAASSRNPSVLVGGNASTTSQLALTPMASDGLFEAPSSAEIAELQRLKQEHEARQREIHRRRLMEELRRQQQEQQEQQQRQQPQQSAVSANSLNVPRANWQQQQQPSTSGAVSEAASSRNSSVMSALAASGGVSFGSLTPVSSDVHEPPPSQSVMQQLAVIRHEQQLQEQQQHQIDIAAAGGQRRQEIAAADSSWSHSFNAESTLMSSAETAAAAAAHSASSTARPEQQQEQEQQRLSLLAAEAAARDSEEDSRELRTMFVTQSFVKLETDRRRVLSELEQREFVDALARFIRQQPAQRVAEQLNNSERSRSSSVRKQQQQHQQQQDQQQALAERDEDLRLLREMFVVETLNRREAEQRSDIQHRASTGYLQLAQQLIHEALALSKAAAAARATTNAAAATTTRSQSAATSTTPPAQLVTVGSQFSAPVPAVSSVAVSTIPVSVSSTAVSAVAVGVDSTTNTIATSTAERAIATTNLPDTRSLSVQAVVVDEEAADAQNAQASAAAAAVALSKQKEQEELKKQQQAEIEQLRNEQHLRDQHMQQEHQQQLEQQRQQLAAQHNEATEEARLLRSMFLCHAMERQEAQRRGRIETEEQREFGALETNEARSEKQIIAAEAARALNKSLDGSAAQVDNERRRAEQLAAEKEKAAKQAEAAQRELAEEQQQQQIRAHELQEKQAQEQQQQLDKLKEQEAERAKREEAERLAREQQEQQQRLELTNTAQKHQRNSDALRGLFVEQQFLRREADTRGAIRIAENEEFVAIAADEVKQERRLLMGVAAAAKIEAAQEKEQRDRLQQEHEHAQQQKQKQHQEKEQKQQHSHQQHLLTTPVAADSLDVPSNVSFAGSSPARSRASSSIAVKPIAGVTAEADPEPEHDDDNESGSNRQPSAQQAKPKPAPKVIPQPVVTASSSAASASSSSPQAVDGWKSSLQLKPVAEIEHQQEQQQPAAQPVANPAEAPLPSPKRRPSPAAVATTSVDNNNVDNEQQEQGMGLAWTSSLMLKPDDHNTVAQQPQPEPPKIELQASQQEQEQPLQRPPSPTSRGSRPEPTAVAPVHGASSPAGSPDAGASSLASTVAATTDQQQQQRSKSSDKKEKQQQPAEQQEHHQQQQEQQQQLLAASPSSSTRPPPPKRIPRSPHTSPHRSDSANDNASPEAVVHASSRASFRDRPGSDSRVLAAAVPAAATTTTTANANGTNDNNSNNSVSPPRENPPAPQPQPKSQQQEQQQQQQQNSSSSSSSPSSLTSLSQQTGIPIEKLREFNPALSHLTDDQPIPDGTAVRVKPPGSKSNKSTSALPTPAARDSDGNNNNDVRRQEEGDPVIPAAAATTVASSSSSASPASSNNSSRRPPPPPRTTDELQQQHQQQQQRQKQTQPKDTDDSATATVPPPPPLERQTSNIPRPHFDPRDQYFKDDDKALVEYAEDEDGWQLVGVVKNKNISNNTGGAPTAAAAAAPMKLPPRRPPARSSSGSGGGSAADQQKPQPQSEPEQQKQPHAPATATSPFARENHLHRPPPPARSTSTTNDNNNGKVNSGEQTPEQLPDNDDVNNDHDRRGATTASSSVDSYVVESLATLCAKTGVPIENLRLYNPVFATLDDHDALPEGTVVRLKPGEKNSDNVDRRDEAELQQQQQRRGDTLPLSVDTATTRQQQQPEEPPSNSLAALSRDTGIPVEELRRQNSHLSLNRDDDPIPADVPLYATKPQQQRNTNNSKHRVDESLLQQDQNVVSDQHSQQRRPPPPARHEDLPRVQLAPTTPHPSTAPPLDTVASLAKKHQLDESLAQLADDDTVSPIAALRVRNAMENQAAEEARRRDLEQIAVEEAEFEQERAQRASYFARQREEKKRQQLEKEAAEKEAKKRRALKSDLDFDQQQEQHRKQQRQSDDTTKQEQQQQRTATSSVAGDVPDSLAGVSEDSVRGASQASTIDAGVAPGSLSAGRRTAGTAEEQGRLRYDPRRGGAFADDDQRDDRRHQQRPQNPSQSHVNSSALLLQQQHEQVQQQQRRGTATAATGSASDNMDNSLSQLSQQQQPRPQQFNVVHLFRRSMIHDTSRGSSACTTPRGSETSSSAAAAASPYRPAAAGLMSPSQQQHEQQSLYYSQPQPAWQQKLASIASPQPQQPQQQQRYAQLAQQQQQQSPLQRAAKAAAATNAPSSPASIQRKQSPLSNLNRGSGYVSLEPSPERNGPPVAATPAPAPVVMPRRIGGVGARDVDESDDDEQQQQRQQQRHTLPVSVNLEESQNPLRQENFAARQELAQHQHQQHSELERRRAKLLLQQQQQEPEQQQPRERDQHQVRRHNNNNNVSNNNEPAPTVDRTVEYLRTVGVPLSREELHNQDHDASNLHSRSSGNRAPHLLFPVPSSSLRESLLVEEPQQQEHHHSQRRLHAAGDSARDSYNNMHRDSVTAAVVADNRGPELPLPHDEQQAEEHFSRLEQQRRDQVDRDVASTRNVVASTSVSRDLPVSVDVPPRVSNNNNAQQSQTTLKATPTPSRFFIAQSATPSKPFTVADEAWVSQSRRRPGEAPEQQQLATSSAATHAAGTSQNERIYVGRDMAAEQQAEEQQRRLEAEQQRQAELATLAAPANNTPLPCLAYIAAQLGFSIEELRRANPHLSKFRDVDPIPEQVKVNLPTAATTTTSSSSAAASSPHSFEREQQQDQHLSRESREALEEYERTHGRREMRIGDRRYCVEQQQVQQQQFARNLPGSPSLVSASITELDPVAFYRDEQEQPLMYDDDDDNSDDAIARRQFEELRDFFIREQEARLQQQQHSQQPQQQHLNLSPRSSIRGSNIASEATTTRGVPAVHLNPSPSSAFSQQQQHHAPLSRNNSTGSSSYYRLNTAPSPVVPTATTTSASASVAGGSASSSAVVDRQIWQRFTWISGKNTEQKKQMERRLNRGFIPSPNRHGDPSSTAYSAHHGEFESAEERERKKRPNLVESAYHVAGLGLSPEDVIDVSRHLNGGGDDNNNSNSANNRRTESSTMTPPRRRAVSSSSGGSPVGSLAWMRENQRKYEQEKNGTTTTTTTTTTTVFAHPIAPVAVPQNARSANIISTASRDLYRQASSTGDNSKKSNNSSASSPNGGAVRAVTTTTTTTSKAAQTSSNHRDVSGGTGSDLSKNRACTLRDISLLFGVPLATLRRYNRLLLKLSNTDPVPTHIAVVLGPAAFGDGDNSGTRNSMKNSRSNGIPASLVRSVMLVLVHPDQTPTLQSLGEDYGVPVKLLKQLNPELLQDKAFLAAVAERSVELSSSAVDVDEGANGKSSNNQGAIETTVIPPRTKLRIPLLHGNNSDGSNKPKSASLDELLGTAAENNNPSSSSRPSLFPGTSVLASATVDPTRYPHVTLLAAAHAIGVRVDDLRAANPGTALDLLNGGDEIPVHCLPLAAPPSCYATEQERAWRERVAVSLSPPRNSNSNNSRRASPYKSPNRAKPLQFTVASPMVKRTLVSGIVATGFGPNNNTNNEHSAVHSVSPRRVGGSGSGDLVPLSPRRDTTGGLVDAERHLSPGEQRYSPDRLRGEGKRASQGGPMVGYVYFRE